MAAAARARARERAELKRAQEEIARRAAAAVAQTRAAEQEEQRMAAAARARARMQERAEARGEMARAAVVIPEQAAEQERSSEEDVDWGELARTQAEHMRQHRRGDTEMQRPQAEQDALRRRTVRSVRRVEQEVR